MTRATSSESRVKFCVYRYTRELDRRQVENLLLYPENITLRVQRLDFRFACTKWRSNSDRTASRPTLSLSLSLSLCISLYSPSFLVRSTPCLHGVVTYLTRVECCGLMKLSCLRSFIVCVSDVIGDVIESRRCEDRHRHGSPPPKNGSARTRIP